MVDFTVLREELMDAEEEKERTKKEHEFLKNNLAKLKKRVSHLIEKLDRLKTEEKKEERNFIRELYFYNISKGELNLLLEKNAKMIEQLEEIKELIELKDINCINNSRLKIKRINDDIAKLKDEVFFKKEKVEKLKQNKKRSLYLRIRRKSKQIEKSLSALMAEAGCLSGSILKAEGQIREIDYKIYQIKQEFVINGKKL